MFCKQTNFRCFTIFLNYQLGFDITRYYLIRHSNKDKIINKNLLRIQNVEILLTIKCKFKKYYFNFNSCINKLINELFVLVSRKFLYRYQILVV